ncbi:hypothetical protein Anas_07246 [Armadillidium nasatum]|uniref:Uncharacterized protein n=1 Tax=Armadillidium nasatum TaxID=96803 RepID=A0A5N5TLW0_9CRUS|nr:hypothetical protein Anas_07246 [Armadillidium nasatum]
MGRTLKVLVVGGRCVGKTAILERLVLGALHPEKMGATAQVEPQYPLSKTQLDKSIRKLLSKNVFIRNSKLESTQEEIVLNDESRIV